MARMPSGVMLPWSGSCWKKRRTHSIIAGTSADGTPIRAAAIIVEKGTAKLSAMLAAMVRLAKMGALAIEFVELDMNKLLDDVISSVAFQTKKLGARIEVDTLPKCFGDKLQIEQIFSNLLDNAIKYAKDADEKIIFVRTGHHGKGYSVSELVTITNNKRRHSIFRI